METYSPIKEHRSIAPVLQAVWDKFKVLFKGKNSQTSAREVPSEKPPFPIDSFNFPPQILAELKVALQEINPHDPYVTDEKHIILYKGLPDVSFEELEQGILPGGLAPKTSDTRYKPGTGVTSYPPSIGVALHALLGITAQSAYSSWTSSRGLAEHYARKKPNGKIVTTTGDLHSGNFISVRKLFLDQAIDYRGVAAACGRDLTDPEFLEKLLNNIYKIPDMCEYLGTDVLDPSNFEMVASGPEVLTYDQLRY